MANERKPVVIDADSFDPVPRNVFRYGNEDYPAFDLMQISNSARERVKRLDKHIEACKTIDQQSELLTAILRDFVPTAPVDRLKDEPIEKLSRSIFALATAGMKRDDADPTMGRRKSASRRSTRR